MGQLDGGTVAAILIGFASLLSYLVSQTSAKSRSNRRRLRRLMKRDIAWSGWAHSIEVWAAGRGLTKDLPAKPPVLADDDEDEDA